MDSSVVTLLVEDLGRLAGALPAGARYPVLERVVARGRRRRIPADSANHLRFRLFGLEPPPEIPVAALGRAAARPDAMDDRRYWLRADPVTLRADMTRVFMTSCGFADFDESERAEVAAVVRDVLLREGIEVRDTIAGAWYLAPADPPSFPFTPLHAALGVDMAEVLPAAPAAGHWKRILTDIQVELHQADVNTRRRASGRQEINSVWFWGGGTCPEQVPDTFDAVHSADPVSAGLARLSGVRLENHPVGTPVSGTVFVDWTMASADALGEAASLEKQVAVLAEGVQRLALVDGSGCAWDYDRAARRRIWKRPRALAESVREAGRDG